MSRFSLTLLLLLVATGFAIVVFTGLSGSNHGRSLDQVKAAVNGNG
jgi:hypothetical protein